MNADFHYFATYCASIIAGYKPEEAEKYLCNNFNVHDREIYSTTIYKNSMNGGPGWMIFSQFSEYSKSFEHAVLRVYDLSNTDIENGE